MDDLVPTDVSTDVSPIGGAAPSSDAVSAPADGGGSAANEPPTLAEQPTEQAEAALQIPETDDDLQGQENNPHVQAVIQLRQELRARNKLVDEYKPLESWKDVATQFSDPSEVIAHRDLIGKIHSPPPEGQSGFTTIPFLSDLEAQSPGTVHKLAMDSLGLQIELNGQTDSLIRHVFRGYGLDPDRLADYKEIDTRAPVGVITQDQLVGIDQKYHAAFKALSQAQRDDVLLQGVVEKDDYGNPARDERGNLIPPRYPAAVMDYLQDKSEALEARSWREQAEQQRQADTQAQQRQFEQDTVKAVDDDISTVRREMYDAIHHTLAQQWKPSSDDAQNEIEYAKVLGILPALFYPEFQFIAENALKQAGVTLNGKFAETANALMGARESYVRHTRQGDQMRARQSLSQSNLAKAQLSTQLNGFALALAKPSAERLQQQSQQTISNLQGATARVVPSGTVQPSGGNGNPYMENPHPLGTPEYLAFNKQIDRQHGVTGAAALAR